MKKYTEEEEKEFLNIERTWDQYDIDLLSALVNMQQIIKQQQQVSKKNTTKRNYSTIEEVVLSYCKFKGINFYLHQFHRFPIIIKYDDYNYALYLAFFLIGLDENKIEPVLDWQLAASKAGVDFVSIVEHHAYKHMKNYSPFNNEMRLKLIQDWVNKKRIFVSTDNSEEPKEFTAKIDWIDGSKDSLIQISRELWGDGYIQHENAFVSVIKYQRKIKWEKEPAALAYLLYKLEEAGKIKSPRRGHFKAAEKLFICDLGDRVAKQSDRSYLRKLNSRVIIDKTNVYKPIKDKIKALLLRVFGSKNHNSVT